MSNISILLKEQRKDWSLKGQDKRERTRISGIKVIVNVKGTCEKYLHQNYVLRKCINLKLKKKQIRNNQEMKGEGKEGLVAGHCSTL